MNPSGEIPVYQECQYILHIKEHLALNWSQDFEGLAVTYTPAGETHLSGFIPDQSALHGVLARIRDLNLTLISINRVVLASKTPEEENEPEGSKANVEE